MNSRVFYCMRTLEYTPRPLALTHFAAADIPPNCASTCPARLVAAPASCTVRSRLRPRRAPLRVYLPSAGWGW